MHADIWNRRAGWLGLMGWIVLSGAFAQAQAPDEKEPKRDVKIRQRALLIDDRDAVAEGKAKVEALSSDYWIGVATSEDLVNDTMRAQLGLPKEQGLAVIEVQPDSPAAKAGLQEFDIMIQAGEQPLRNVGDLMKAVEGTEGKDLAITLYRKGKQETLTVTPAKRPEEMRATPQGAFRDWVRRRGGLPDDVVFDRWLSGKGEGPFNMLMVRPGVVLPPGAMRAHQLPDNLTVSVTRKGGEPAKIKVRRGEEEWEVSEDALGELPEDVRSHVEAMLMDHRGKAFSFQAAPPMVERFTVPADANAGGSLSEVQKQVQELRQSVEELKQMLKDKD